MSSSNRGTSLPSDLIDLALVDEEQRAGRCRCLLLEDCDEFVRVATKDL